MVVTTNKISWEKIGPFVLFWMLPTEINNVKNFLELRAAMSFEHMLKLIWYMMRPKDSWLINIVDQDVQDAYDCIACSPQLTIEHTKLLSIGDEFLLLNEEISSIKRNMMNLFERNNFRSRAAKIMIISVLRLTAPELIEELFHHYNDVYMTYLHNHGYGNRLFMHLEMPSVLVHTERSRVRARMRDDPFSNDHRMMSMHFRLEAEVANFREKVAAQIVTSMKEHAVHLRQMLEEHPVA